MAKQIITGPSHNPIIPEIYQIELCSRCNFSCNFCAVGKTFNGKVTKDSFIDLDLVNTIATRDIQGSYFIELQFRGEPTLHKQLNEIVDILSPHVFLGLSTNGSLIHKQLEALLKLDYLTISVDGATKITYEQLRRGGNYELLLSNLKLLMEARGDNETPHIDLQFLDFPDKKSEADLGRKLANDMGWDVTIRLLQDCFVEENYPDQFKVESNDLCVNPWTSVSVLHSGDVVACCRMFNEEVCYGNLYEQSLEEIWKTSPVLSEFREQHRSNTNLPYVCTSCFQRSSYFLHQKLYQNAIQHILRRRKLRDKGVIKDLQNSHVTHNAEYTLTDKQLW